MQRLRYSDRDQKILPEEGKEHSEKSRPTRKQRHWLRWGCVFSGIPSHYFRDPWGDRCSKY